MFEREWRLFSEVPRWATIRSRGQRLAEHSFYVALYADQIADLIKWEGDRGELLHRALLHDVDELVSGDLPGTWKRQVGRPTTDVMSASIWRILDRWFGCWITGMLKPSDDLMAIVRCADALEDCLFAALERRHGNPDFDVVSRTAWDKMRGAIDTMPVDSSTRVNLERAITRAINDHRHEAPRFI